MLHVAAAQGPYFEEKTCFNYGLGSVCTKFKSIVFVGPGGVPNTDQQTYIRVKKEYPLPAARLKLI